jgi:hypothetical protein
MSAGGIDVRVLVGDVGGDTPRAGSTHLPGGRRPTPGTRRRERGRHRPNDRRDRRVVRIREPNEDGEETLREAGGTLGERNDRFEDPVGRFETRTFGGDGGRTSADPRGPVAARAAAAVTDGTTDRWGAVADSG